MEIIDNFLDQNDFEQILELHLGKQGHLPWYYGGAVTGEDPTEEKHFSHMFYGFDQPVSEWMKQLLPFKDKLGINSLVRIKSNLTTKTPEIIEHGFHRDVEFLCKTAVYYVNTCDGYTKFEDGSIVESVANRVVIFDSNMKHTGTTCTDTDARVVINFNYF